MLVKLNQLLSNFIVYSTDPNRDAENPGTFAAAVAMTDHNDFNEVVGRNRTMGSLYDLIAAENLSEKNNDDIRANGPERWNRAKIVIKGGEVQHWINNIKIVEYNRFSQTLKSLIKKSKFQDFKGYAVGSNGRILLQDHEPGDIKFKNIKIREF